jgi:hypothetical protein
MVMEISNSLAATYQGIRALRQNPEQNVTAVANTESTRARDIQTQDRATTEQTEIVNSLQSNARSLQAAGQRVGTLLDVQA